MEELNPDKLANEPISSKKTFNKLIRVIKGLSYIIIFMLFLAFIPVYLLFWVDGVKDVGVRMTTSNHNTFNISDSLSSNGVKLFKSLEKEYNKNLAKLNTYTPKQSFIVINISENTFKLYNAKRALVREGVCSTGSYITLESGKKKWEFQTPKGMLKVHGKITNPVWVRPDWSFIEEGLPIPSARHDSRYEYGVLGDYAMSLGDGYLIHGTIYQRFLGMPVTHGCVRLGDDDLEVVYKTLVLGSKVYIY